MAVRPGFPVDAPRGREHNASSVLSMAPASKIDRYFYSVVAFILLVFTWIGFRRFYLQGRETDGEAIPTPIKALVIIHGTALTLWIFLFLFQSLLIANRSRKLHMNLGWFGAAIAAVIALSGPFVAILSVRTRPTLHLFGLTYPQFLLPMLTEIAAFTIFVALGIWHRKKAPIHRPMMLLATLSIISGATARTGFFGPLFGRSGWSGFFGPVFTLAALFLVARLLLTRRIDWWYAMGGTALAGVYFVVMQLALADSWTEWARRIAQN